ncbi:ferrous iron transport protein B [Paenibacillus sp. SYP-B3998]|uniref:Ferrous iron transport protein B n=1 Tax=Paenibacillus sp. SYP-B3998 TaxID=2678564 RepID=A0A6G3ZWE2_9BACL|nr:ferrous iron transport protein B [Paenibacillus sp. SYP-B3998]NEW05891.1 ferrous iron transport protein B [Paenibacillus sp. SYP-B3998]
MLTVALIGNPNTGKSSLFNTLTSSYEYVGNWSGVTVEKKVGLLKNKQGQLVDLPGIYSLSPLSKDEGITTQYLLQEEYSFLLNVIDASQLKRNLHLTLQLLEVGKPLIIALNMIDVAKRRGLQIDVKALSEMLQVPIAPVLARSGAGCHELSQHIATYQPNQSRSFQLQYGSIIDEAIIELSERLPEETKYKRWLALQFFEENSIVRALLESQLPKEWLAELQLTTENAIRKLSGVSPRQYIQHVRSEAIDSLMNKCVQQKNEIAIPFSERIDQIVTNKYLGIPLFLAAMYVTFKLTFEWVGGPLSDLLDGFLHGKVNDMLNIFLDQVGASEAIHSVIINGIVAGVGGVLVFIPQIFVLFGIISFIEDSGYMARVATVMDKLMELVGLNGKAFIPMIIGFGCNVPGIMAARSIEQPKERLLTILLTPLMSCSARLTVYSLFVGTFFPKNQAIIVLSLYVIGILVALLLAKVFSLTIFKEEKSIFVIELPPYRLPQWTTLFRGTWEKGKGFVKKAGSFIFGGSVTIWLLSYSGPSGWNLPMEKSFLHVIGNLIAPLLTPLGFGNWQAGASLISGFFAKEVVVSTMNIIYKAPSEEQLQGILSNFFTPLQAYCFMAFILLYVPCLATVGVIKKETSSSRWTWFAVTYSLCVAYFLTFIIFKIGTLLGFA